MREIKFRGKRKDNGEWVYGYFYKYPNGNCWIYSITEEEAKQYEVYSHTVEQFTGLTDINGKEIYEKDRIVEYQDQNPNNRLTVRYDKGCFYLQGNKKNYSIWPYCSYSVVVGHSG